MVMMGMMVMGVMMVMVVMMVVINTELQHQIPI